MAINWNPKQNEKCLPPNRPLYSSQDVFQYRGWATGTPSTGERETLKFIDRRIIPAHNLRVLHHGTGRNDLAIAISGLPRVARFDSITIFPLEQAKATANGVPCCAVYVLDKHDKRTYLTAHGPYDIIVDVNIASFACCYFHLTQMMQIWINRLLSPGGVIVTHSLGMKYHHSKSPVSPLMTDDLASLAKHYSLTLLEPVQGQFVFVKPGDFVPLKLEGDIPCCSR